MMGGKPAVYLQTHTVRDGKRTITNEWFEVMDDVSGTPKFSKLTEDKTPPGMVKSITVTGAPAWFSLFSPAVAKNIVARIICIVHVKVKKVCYRRRDVHG